MAQFCRQISCSHLCCSISTLTYISAQPNAWETSGAMHVEMSGVGLSVSAMAATSDNQETPYCVNSDTSSPVPTSRGLGLPLTDMTSAESTPETNGGKRRRRRPKYGRLKRVALKETPNDSDENELECIVIVEEKDDVCTAMKKLNAIGSNADVSRPCKLGGPPLSTDGVKTTSGSEYLQPLSLRHNGNYDAKSPTGFVKGAKTDDDENCLTSGTLKIEDSAAKSTSSPTKKRFLKGRESKSQQCKHYAKQFVAIVFSTVGVMCLMVGYTILGGYIFMELEAPNEVGEFLYQNWGFGE